MADRSLVKFSKDRGAGDQQLFWHRYAMGADNLPYRGAQAPLMREEEYEERVTRVADVRNAFFNAFDLESNELYLRVIDRVFNGWFQLIHLERFWVDGSGKRTTFHYVEWAEFYLEDGSRTPFLTQSMQELANGQQNLA